LAEARTNKFNSTLKSHSNTSKIGSKAAGDREMVEFCMSAICRKAGMADPGSVTQRDLKFLSGQIEAKTGVLISLSTIRRLINGQFSRIPQVATLDAIARFLDYQNWQDFKKITLDAAAAPSAPALTAPAPVLTARHPAVTPRRRNPSYIRPLSFAGLLLLATLGLFAVIRIRKPGIANLEKAQFSAVKVTANDLPNTVVFKYNIDQIDADSFFIQQSWDKNRRVRIYKKNYTLTDIYYEPGYHNAKLIANDQIIKTMPVSIPTDRWFYYVKERGVRTIPKYIQPAGDPAKPSASTSGPANTTAAPRSLTLSDLTGNGIDIHKNNQYLQVYFPTRLETNSDDCDLHFRIRVDPVSNAVCPYFMTEIFCQHYFMYFISMTKGCSSESSAQFGENDLDGKTHDLSALSTDSKTWQDVEFAIHNRKVSIRINHAEVLAAEYHQPCGLVTGLGFISNGLSTVDSIRFTNGTGSPALALAPAAGLPPDH
jgi:hypothetical protein